MEESLSIIPSLYLPVIGKSLILPNVSVAEIVDYQAPETVPETPDWYLGHVKWRGVTLPVISYDMLNETPLPEDLINTRLAVINTISSDHDSLPFFAIVTQGIPRQVKVDEESIKPIEDDENKGPADLMKVTILGDEAVIPNVEYVESMIVKNR